MKKVKELKEFLTEVVEVLGLAHWIEIMTENPRCTYYFGPFLSEKEAEAAKAGYIEDLEQEGATGIIVKVKRCKPTNLTVFDDSKELTELAQMPTLSSQIS